jgi:hypothetical protein
MAEWDLLTNVQAVDRGDDGVGVTGHLNDREVRLLLPVAEAKALGQGLVRVAERREQSFRKALEDMERRRD